jgi:hypothetical protein
MTRLFLPPDVRSPSDHASRCTQGSRATPEPVLDIVRLRLVSFLDISSYITYTCRKLRCQPVARNPESCWRTRKRAFLPHARAPFSLESFQTESQ